MTVFQFLRGPYLVILGVAAILHILLAYFAPDPLAMFMIFIQMPLFCYMKAAIYLLQMSAGFVTTPRYCPFSVLDCFM